MKTSLISVAIASALFAGAAQAQVLDGAAAQKVMSGATITGTNAAGNPYEVTFATNGGVKGTAGANNEFKDTGAWWMEGDQFCRQYKIWFENQIGCYGISTKGNMVNFHDKSGKVVDTSKLN